MVLGAIVIIAIVLVFLITAIPLNIAVHLLGGESNIVKTAIVNLIVGIAGALLTGLLPFGGIIAFLALLAIYSFMFQLGFLRAFLAWVLQFVIAMLLFWLLVVLGVIVL